MAEENKKINIEIDVDKASIGELQAELSRTQQQLKTLQQGTKEWNDAFQRVGAIKDKLKELKENIRTAGDTIEGSTKAARTLQGGLSAIGEVANKAGLESKVLTKALEGVQVAGNVTEVVTSFKDFTQVMNVLKASLLSNPIMILATILIGVGAALYSLRDSVQPVKLVFNSLGDAVNYVVELLKKAADFLGLYDLEQEKLEKSTKKLAEEQQKTSDSRIKQLEREKALSEARGEGVISVERQIIAEKQKSILAEIKYLETLKDRTDEENKRLGELKEQYKDLNAQKTILDIKQKEEEEKRRKESYEKYKEWLEKQAQARDKALDNELKTIEINYGHQIKLAQIRGKDTLQLELELSEKKLEILQKAYDVEIKLGNKASKERIDDLMQGIKMANFVIEEIRAKINKAEEDRSKKDIEDVEKKRIEEIKERINQETQEIEKGISNINDKYSALFEASQGSSIAILDVESKKFQELKQLYDKHIADYLDMSAKKLANNEQLTKEELDRYEKLVEGKRKLEEDFNRKTLRLRTQTFKEGLDALSSLSDTWYNFEIAKANTDAKRKREIEKKKFVLDKGVSSIRAAINTAEGVTKAIAAYPPPFNAVAAAVVGAMGAVQIATILSKQFPETGDTGGASIAQPSSGALQGLSGGADANQPQQPLKPFVPEGFETKDVKRKDEMTIKAVVVETDIYETQRRVNNIKESSSY